MPKSYRIRTEVGQDKYINVQLEQDFEQLEILSLKINESDIYTRVCSDYGVVVGRVLVNGGFGVPNAKVSVFIPLSSEDETNPIISELYPYKSLSDLNEDGYRYNLLPKDPSYSVHAATGTFPTRQEVLLDQSYIEVYDKYYKFSVKTNDSGDFMIFGVPTGNQTIVMDVDLSDIGCFSLAPQDLIDLGIASPSQVNGNTFKASSNLSELPQIKTLNKVVEISPFWGDVDICQFGITRVDFDLTAEANIKIEPKAVFMGSIITNAEDDALKTNCKPKNNTGNLCELITGPGQIFAIRHTIFPDQFNRPQLETYEFDDNGKVIDGDGSFLVNVPMNIDYVITNEFGQQVISTDPKKGIPTKGRYRFKFKWENEQGLQNQYQRANFLVPNIKEHGWTSSGNDPFNPSSTSQVVITLPAGVVTGTTIPVVGTGGYLLEDRINSANLTIIINGQPYFGDPTSIPVTAGDTIQFISNPVDNTQLQTFNITFLPQSYFDVLKSYAFSLDWDDYNDVQGAINCEDTFYEFNFNKVYTTAMFLDRYKNGLGRARHLGIKEIDNRTCKTTVNTFPVNDIIRNFDFLFFVFNLLINILTFPILVLLFIAHLICFLWPILKYALIFLGLWLIYQQVAAAVEFTNSVLELTAVAVPGGPVINTGVILRTIWEGLQILFRLALSILFTIFVVNRLIKIKNFPRIALPMLSYPECNTCECDCKNAEQDDDFDSSTISQQIQNTANSLQSSSGSQPQTATSTSFLAPINLPQTYLVNHPNLEQRPGFDGNDDSGGYFLLCNAQIPIPPFPLIPIEYRSLVNRIVAQDVGPNVVTQAVLDFKRLFSGYDVLSGNDFRRFKAPQPFLFSVDKIGDNPLIPINYDQRYYAQPRTVPYPQRLNEFNTRDKYFSGVNRIQMKVNNSAPINDQILVMLVNPGTKESLVAGSLFSFQDPKTSNCQINLTGATLNQFDNNAITGTSLTNPISITQTINYATSPTANASVQISIIQSGSSENYLKYPTDIEYYQVITGLTVGSFATLANFTNPNDFPLGYLYHKIRYDIMKPTDCWNPPATPLASPPYVTSPTVAHGKTVNNFTALQQINSYQNYEILFVVRGVDPHTEKQNIKYDLSRIFGKAIGTGPTFEGQYYLNIPIQGYPGGTKPKSHKTTTNTSPNLYFPSYTFTIDPTMYSAFTSTLPYYFISTDDSTVPNNSNYKPTPVHQTTQTIAGTPLTQIGGTSSYKLPKYDTQPLQIGGGTFIAYKSNSYPFNPTSTFPGVPYFQSLVYGTPQQQKEAYGWPGPTSNPTNDVYALYSSAYYRFTTLTPVNFNNSVNIVMRSDRLPTSSRTENGFDPRTGYGLHQNNNFKYYTVDAAGDNGTTTSFAPSLPSGESADTDIPPNILSTLDCENIVPLECYQGTGVNLSINPNCAIPPNRVVKGCYCLLNYVENNDPVTSLIFKKLYLIKKQFETDAKLFVEWKTRFTITFAACRGVFAQTFQNNWINGTLYMFTFNKRNRYSLTNPTQPTYDYCEDVILFNDINNGFYYRSSPWNGTNFIGKNSPAPPSGIPPVLINDYPGLGYNGKQIQFPTTIVDLGPREKFISEICTSSNFDGYMIDQVKSTSYQDNSDIIQLGFLSRLTNDRFIQAVIPISNPAGDNTEGKGIIQFFNSNRKADRIDGDFAQMLSINSEWRITPFLAENYSLIPNSIFFDEDTQTGNGYPRPVFGLFFQTPVIDYTYRRNLTPGYETLNYSPLLQNYYGFPKTQDVPFYRWKIESQSNFIFGNENNNWDVTPAPGQPGTGFLTRGYQDLDFTLPNQYYKTPTTQFGYLTNYDVAGNPQPSPNFADSYLVGAPYHFYFGLNNGKTAIDKFIKLYISTEG